jgi:hypothetical protein
VAQPTRMDNRCGEGTRHQTSESIQEDMKIMEPQRTQRGQAATRGMS